MTTTKGPEGPPEKRLPPTATPGGILREPADVSALSADEARSLTDEIKTLETTISGVARGVDLGLALLAVDLDRAGGRLIPPMFPGGHTYIVMPDGLRLSLAAFYEYMRLVAVIKGRCPCCDGPLYQSTSRNSASSSDPFSKSDSRNAERGPRIDRRYCSNACRQKAYRQRLDAQPETRRPA